ncbi:hypothetical protein EMIHUDRAFT_120208 [Emiliania huxleyi CCMP1516]|uniref:Uncharacterized protein n=2 Tax=Emiliania huxleyi TaxID=2903 RepID=A0A0D3IL64_EMIH1|nr:hypothetical protein EMIHUDRAFT_120208 [Emiliania huxleyi CCMP1516]EOD11999.1 hypothetical protein EMIHUDRAFT_120208 [Emiliania huxleyi CCMP1516]|eukprot:XP_005764428.1 hypothetical protein EMIHUDRAFT_120208 [Emiliania huxleyi CCMP1516]
MLALGFAAAAATSGSPPNRRSGGPDLQKLSTARERLFEAELELQGALAREASRPGPRPVSKALDRLQSVLVAALASPDEDGLCRLHHAVLEQDEDRVKCLVGAGAQTEVAAGEAGVLPLHLAVLAGDGSPGCMRELLAGGAKVDAPDTNGVTALHAACGLNQPQLTSLLLDAGATPEARGAHGASPDARDERLRTACHAAAARDASEAIEALHELLRAAPPSAARQPDLAGRTPLHFAAASGSAPCVKALLAAGAAPAAASAIGWTALHEAANASQPAAAAALLAAGAESTAAAAGGATPLHLAVERVGVGVGGCRCKWCRRRRSRQLRTLRTLLSELNGGADQGTAAGTTPAHIAAAHDSVAALRLLRARRSPLWRRDASGRTPLDVAREARRGASRFVQRLLLLGQPAPT